MELGRFHIEYEQKTTIKWEVLADFTLSLAILPQLEMLVILHAQLGGKGMLSCKRLRMTLLCDKPRIQKIPLIKQKSVLNPNNGPYSLTVP